MQIKLYSLGCDHCRRPLVDDRGNRVVADSNRAVRQLAKQYGWRRVPKISAASGKPPQDGADICTRCKVTRDGAGL